MTTNLEEFEYAVQVMLTGRFANSQVEVTVDPSDKSLRGAVVVEAFLKILGRTEASETVTYPDGCWQAVKAALHLPAHFRTVTLTARTMWPESFEKAVTGLSRTELVR